MIQGGWTRRAKLQSDPGKLDKGIGRKEHGPGRLEMVGLAEKLVSEAGKWPSEVGKWVSEAAKWTSGWKPAFSEVFWGVDGRKLASFYLFEGPGGGRREAPPRWR